METTLQEINKEIIGLKTDLAQIDVLVEKLDLTIDKLSEVSQNISELIAVHGSRLEMQEKLIAEIFNKIERRAQEANENLRYLKNELIESEKEIQATMAQEIADLEENQSKFMKEFESRYEKINERIKIYDKWVWVLVGIAIAIAIFTHNTVNLLKYFT